MYAFGRQLDLLVTLFSFLNLMGRFPTLNRWIQMQTNLHRVSEFAVTAKSDDNVGIATLEGKTSSKRPREFDSDAESEVDDTVACSHLSVNLADFNVQGRTASDPWLDSPKSENVELEPTAFLSFDWENEGPYEKAVDRYE